MTSLLQIDFVISEKMKRSPTIPDDDNPFASNQCRSSGNLYKMYK